MAFGVNLAKGLLMSLPILATESLPDLTWRSVETRDVRLRERSVFAAVSVNIWNQCMLRTYAIEGVNKCIVDQEVFAEDVEDGRALADYRCAWLADYHLTVCNRSTYGRGAR